MTFHRRTTGALQRSIDISAGQEHRRTFSESMSPDTLTGATGAKLQNPRSGAPAHLPASPSQPSDAGHRRISLPLKEGDARRVTGRLPIRDREG